MKPPKYPSIVKVRLSLRIVEAELLLLQQRRSRVRSRHHQRTSIQSPEPKGTGHHQRRCHWRQQHLNTLSLGLHWLLQYLTGQEAQEAPTPDVFFAMTEHDVWAALPTTLQESIVTSIRGKHPSFQSFQEQALTFTAARKNLFTYRVDLLNQRIQEGQHVLELLTSGSPPGIK